MLCAVCMKIFQSSELSGNHHQNSNDVETAAKNGCRICQEVGDLFPPVYAHRLTYRLRKWRAWANTEFFELRILWETVFIHVSRADGFPDGYDKFLNSSRADLDTDPCRVRRDFPTQRLIADNTGHESVTALARKWLNDCKREHHCEQVLERRRQQGWFPSRLVKVGGVGEPPCLVTREKGRFEGAYASLSHCWGENPSFLKLTTSNLDELCEEIPLASLPASFRDAILTCQRLDIPYLWIDALCILQSGPGSESDWLFHVSGEMSRIYSYCELNISIDVAASPEEGAFRSRDPSFLQDCYVWTTHAHLTTPSLSHPKPDSLEPSSDSKQEDHSDQHPANSNPSSSSSLTDPVTEPPPPIINLYTIFTKTDLNHALWNLPLGKRAWVFQELLLSPRTLHFQTDRISWQCERRERLTEYLHDDTGPSSRAKFGLKLYYQVQYNLEEGGGGGDLREDNISKQRASYYDRVFQYTARELSRPDKDKLVAFSAVARHYATFLGEEYHAGVFGSTMPIGLLWNVGRVPPATRPGDYRAPSWSWAGQDGRVFWHNISELEGRQGEEFPAGGVEKVMLLARVEDARVELVDETNQYGQVKGAWLTMKGPMMCWRDVIGSYREGDELGSATKRIDSGEYDSIVRTGVGVKIWLHADEPGPWSWNSRVPWGRKPQRVFMMAVANIKLTEEEIQRREAFRHKELEDANFDSRCVGLFLRPLEDGTFRRLGNWKADIDVVERYKAVAGGFKESTVVLV